MASWKKMMPEDFFNKLFLVLIIVIDIMLFIGNYLFFYAFFLLNSYNQIQQKKLMFSPHLYVWSQTPLKIVLSYCFYPFCWLWQVLFFLNYFYERYLSHDSLWIVLRRIKLSSWEFCIPGECFNLLFLFLEIWNLRTYCWITHWTSRLRTLVCPIWCRMESSLGPAVVLRTMLHPRWSIKITYIFSHIQLLWLLTPPCSSIKLIKISRLN